MALFPLRPGVEPGTVLAAYLDETADIPLPWLREVVPLYRGSGLEWLPSLPKLREAIAKRVRHVRREALGQSQHDTVEQVAINTEGILQWVSEKVPLGLAQLEAVCGKDRERRAIEAENREAVQAEDQTPQQQRSELTGLTLKHIEDLIAADGLTGQLNRRQHERAREHRRTG